MNRSTQVEQWGWLAAAGQIFFSLSVGFGGLITLTGAIWFFMLFLAAITSSVSMYQPTLAFLRQSLGWDRRKATTLLVALCLVGSFLVMYYSRDGLFLATLDAWVGTFLIFVLATVQIICFSWVFGVRRGVEEAHRGALDGTHLDPAARLHGDRRETMEG